MSKHEAARRATAASAAAKYTRKAVAKRLANSHKEPPPRTIGHGAVCWCGQPFNHDWPGKDDGEAHPR